TLEAATVPTTSPTTRLTTSPEDQLSSPLDQRTASLRFRPGGPPAAEAGGSTRESSSSPAAGSGAGGGVDRATAAFTALVGERSLSPGFALVALLLAVGLGAAHALAPGHGKTVMAAYLVGLRGNLRQAATIGATVTLTHTAGVLLLGLVLTTSRAVASERVYPWLGLGSGLLLAGVGIGLLVRARPGHGHPHPHGHELHHPHPHGQEPDHQHSHHHDPDQPGAAGGAGRPLGWRGLVALGLAGGLVPSPSAVVVLLGGIALGQAWFGVALVLAYGLGMAATLTGVGLLLAHLRTRMDRRLRVPAGSVLGRIGRLLPAVTASVIVLVGLGLAASGAAQL
ncbi:MAG TPA: sulfite exporter TauE/SafE family protein, partial [Actinomycetota bacterium]|nr:sulfite exporter TauE/SafE family protein [Actinomycetota bacterium]